MSKFKEKYKWKDRDSHFNTLNFRKKLHENMIAYYNAVIKKEINRKPIFLGISGYLNKIKDK